MTLPEEHWFWLSFADPDQPTGAQFLGGCVVTGWSLRDAINRTHTLGINPGGSIESVMLESKPDGWPVDRLLSRSDIEVLDGSH